MLDTNQAALPPPLSPLSPPLSPPPPPSPPPTPGTSCECTGSSNCVDSSSYSTCGGAGLVCGARVEHDSYGLGYVARNGDNASDPNVLVCFDSKTNGHLNSYGCNQATCDSPREAFCNGQNGWWTTCSQLDLQPLPPPPSPPPTPCTSDSICPPPPPSALPSFSTVAMTGDLSAVYEGAVALGTKAGAYTRSHVSST
jgi:hypothetical protein